MHIKHLSDNKYIILNEEKQKATCDESDVKIADIQKRIEQTKIRNYALSYDI